MFQIGYYLYSQPLYLIKNYFDFLNAIIPQHIAPKPHNPIITNSINLITIIILIFNS